MYCKFKKNSKYCYILYTENTPVGVKLAHGTYALYCAHLYKNAKCPLTVRKESNYE